MTTNKKYIKGIFSLLIVWSLFSITFAATTSKQGRDILNQLKSEWRTDADIKSTMEDLWLDTSGYFPDTKNNATSSSSNSSSSSSESVYTSRSCKVYNIEYEASLWVYTSRNLVKKEYFINPDYFKRYVDSKNPQISGCPVNGWWINTSYIDNSNSSTRYTAPNWKVYFITNQNWSYTSKELNTTKTFTTIDELKNYIKNRNPLISMWTQNSNNTQNNLPVNNNSNNSTDNAISKIWNEIFS